MPSVSVNSPKTPVTKGSNGIAAATVPNVCKMPGPPAPFVPTPLPNIGKSGISPKGYTKDVKVEGHAVAVQGASFGSTGDAASKGTGGGVVSANAEGMTKFVGPGSLNVKFEGRNVQLLGDPMINNCGPSGSPANAATLAGVLQEILAAAQSERPNTICHAPLGQTHDGPNGTPPIAVEVKSKPKFNERDARQLGRNCLAVTSGGASGLIYKIPAGGKYAWLTKHIRDAGSVMDVAIKVIRI